MTPRARSLSRGASLLGLVVLGACAGGARATHTTHAELAPQPPAAAAARPTAQRKTSRPLGGRRPTISLRLPDHITEVSAQIRNPLGEITGTCTSRLACQSLQGWNGPSGAYSISVDYLAPDGVRESFSERFFAGYDELSIVMHFFTNRDGLLEVLVADVEAAPIAGVALRVAGPSAYGELPSIKLVNRSGLTIYVPSSGRGASLRVDEHDDAPRSSSFGCGFGSGVIRVPSGTSVPAVARPRTQPMIQGRYQVNVLYGVSEAQMLNSLTRREVSLDLQVEGPPPDPAAGSASSRRGRFDQRAPPAKRPPPGFAPAKTEGARDPGLARWIELEQEVAGTLTPGAPHRTFRVRTPPNTDSVAAEFYARCQHPPCAGRAYAVLNGPRDGSSVSDARDLRASGGWTSLEDEQGTSQGQSFLLVVGCVGGCTGPVQFFGRAHAWKSDLR